MVLTSNELRDIAEELSERLKVDYVNFNEGFFRRRLNRMMEKMCMHRLQDLDLALGALVKYDEMTFYLSQPTSEMFRSPASWRLLRRLVGENPRLRRFWLPALASYHDLYGLLILLDQAGLDDWQLTCNTVSERITRSCRELVVERADDQQDHKNYERLEAPQPWEHYVGPDHKLLPAIAQALERVQFRGGWFLNMPEGERYDVVVLRNELLNYNFKLHRQSILRLVEALDGPGSILCIGSMERPLGAENLLDDRYAEQGIYIKM